MTMGGNSCGGPGSDSYKTPSTSGGGTSEECKKKGHDWEKVEIPNMSRSGSRYVNSCRRCEAIEK